MATTAQWIFEQAMHLMDEVNESTGASDIATTGEYKNRTLSILNILRTECYSASDTYAYGEDGRRPLCPQITDFTTELDLDDGIAQGVLPYGLAAHLLLDENDAKAAFFQQRYQELLNRYRHAIPSESEPIELPYGGIGVFPFGRW